jgi:hypothetical protein
VSELPKFVNLIGWLWLWLHRIRLADGHDVCPSRHLRQARLAWHDASSRNFLTLREVSLLLWAASFSSSEEMEAGSTSQEEGLATWSAGALEVSGRHATAASTARVARASLPLRGYSRSPCGPAFGAWRGSRCQQLYLMRVEGWWPLRRPQWLASGQTCCETWVRRC